MSNRVISYASGGLGNVLLPLCSSILFSKKTNKDMLVCWEPTFACMATFEDLFENENIHLISKKDLLKLNDVKIYGSLSDINYDSFLFKNNSFQVLTLTNQVLPVNFLNPEDKNQNIIIYHNNILPTLNKGEVINEIKSLKWKKDILDKIEHISSELKIDNSVFGISARATDFNNSLDLYTNAIKSLIKDSSTRFFISSDSVEWEEKICNMFPDNCFRRQKSAYVTKQNENIDTWSNNILRSSDSVIEAVIDAHLLSKTDFKVYNAHSSYAQLINYLK